MSALDNIQKGPLESLIDDKVKEARGRDLLRGAFIQGQAPVDTSLLKKEDFVDPVMALPRDLATKGGVGNLLKSVAAGSLGLLGDLGSIFPGAQNSIAGQAPTTDELGERFGADFSRPGGMLGMVGAPDPGDIARLGGKGLLAMTLFHGTPHRFKQFELSPKTIHTGEGNTSFGHGLYFAENPGVARSYQANLAGANTPEIDKINSQLDSLEDIIADGPDSMDGLRARQAYDDLQVEKQKLLQGHLYEVELPDEITERMLDWDAPLSEQPESVQKALAGFDLGPGAEIATTATDGPFAGYGYTLRNEVTGESLYKHLRETRGEEAASKALNEAGIPGIRFYDGSSRGKQARLPFQEGLPEGWRYFDDKGRIGIKDDKGLIHTDGFATEADAHKHLFGEKGTRNIVVFDPDDITQVKRDGELVFENKSGLKPDKAGAIASDLADQL